MAVIVHKTEKEVWAFASRQMGGLKAFKNMIDDENKMLEKMVEETTNEAKGVLPEGAKVEDIKVETSNLNGPVVNVTIKASL